MQRPALITKGLLTRLNKKKPYANCRAARYFSADVKGTIPKEAKGIAVSQFASVDRIFSADDVTQFGNLIQDHNSLHSVWPISNLPPELESHPLFDQIISKDEKDESFSSTTAASTKVIVHGMLVSSLFSSIFGTIVPGAVYLKQTLDFRSPVFVYDKVVGRVDIIRVRQFKRRGVIVTCDTTVRREHDDVVCVAGKADVWLPGGSKAD